MPFYRTGNRLREVMWLTKGLTARTGEAQIQTQVDLSRVLAALLDIPWAWGSPVLHPPLQGPGGTGCWDTSYFRHALGGCYHLCSCWGLLAPDVEHHHGIEAGEELEASGPRWGPKMGVSREGEQEGEGSRPAHPRLQWHPSTSRVLTMQAGRDYHPILRWGDGD